MKLFFQLNLLFVLTSFSQAFGSYCGDRTAEVGSTIYNQEHNIVFKTSKWFDYNDLRKMQFKRTVPEQQRRALQFTDIATQDGEAYVSSNNSVTVINPKNGMILRKYPVPGDLIVRSLAVDDNLIYLAVMNARTNESSILKLDSNSGKISGESWPLDIYPNSIKIVGNRLLVTGKDTVQIYDLTFERKIDSIYFPKVSFPSLTGELVFMSSDIESVDLYNNTVYMTDRSRGVISFNLKDRIRHWFETPPLQAGHQYSPQGVTVNKDKVYVSDYNDGIAVFDRTTRRFLNYIQVKNPDRRQTETFLVHRAVLEGSNLLAIGNVSLARIPVPR